MYEKVETWDKHLFELKPSKKKKFKRIIELMPDDKESKILDAGCGDGLLHGFLKEAGYTNIQGFDYTEHFIETARFNHPDIKYKVHDACQKFPYKKNSFDIVLSVEVMEHVPSPHLVIKNMYDVCKPGGCLVLSAPNALKAELCHGFDKNWKISDTVFQYLSPTVLRGILQSVGFKVVKSDNSGIRRINHMFFKAVKLNV